MAEHVCACGMHICQKCAIPMIIFGLLFLVSGLGLWAGAPIWFNLSTLVGLFLALLGVMSFVMK